MNSVVWLITLYPWGLLGPTEIKTQEFSLKSFPTVSACRAQALISLDTLIADFEDIAPIDKKYAMVSCSVNCTLREGPPVFFACDEVYRWNGKGVAWNPGDPRPMSQVEVNRWKRTQKTIEETIIEMKKHINE